MKTYMKNTVILWLLLAAWMCTARADEVILTNGDRLTGKIVSLIDGKMTFESELLGTLTIDAEKVRTFSTTEPAEIHTDDGAVLWDTANQSGGRQVQVDTRTLELSRIQTINPPPPPVPAGPKWTGDITANFAAQRGNTVEDTANVRMTAERKTDIDSIRAQGQYRFSQKENDRTGLSQTTEDALKLGAKYTRDFNDTKWYWFTSGDYQKDRIANLDQRLIGALGAGYRWIESEDMNFATELGVAAIHEEYSDPKDTNDDITLQAGYEFDKKINDKLFFVHTLTYYPSIHDTEDYLIQTDAELRYHLTEKLFSSFRIEIDYDSTPAENSDTTDQRYLVGLGWTFRNGNSCFAVGILDATQNFFHEMPDGIIGRCPCAFFYVPNQSSSSIL